MREPARYDDELEILTTGALLSRLRVRFDHDVCRQADATPLATGHTVHASLDSSGRPRRLPERVRNMLTP